MLTAWLCRPAEGMWSFMASALGDGLERMRSVDVRTVDPGSLVDISDVHVDESLPQGERMGDFMRQVGNPYCFKCGKAVIKMGFADTEATLEERLEQYLAKL